MKIISRYLLVEFLRVLIMTLVGFISIFIIVDFFEKIDNFLEVKLPLSRALEFFLLSIPNILFQISPVAVLVAVLISLGLLARHSEIVAFKAGGVSLYRLSRPILFASVAVSLLMFGLAETVIPRTSAVVNRIWSIEVEQNEDAASPIRKDVWFKADNGVYHFASYNEAEKTLSGICILLFNQDFRLVERIEAASGRLIGPRWELKSGVRKTYLANGEIFVKRFETRMTDMPEMPTGFADDEKSAEEMSSAELARWIDRMRRDGYDPLRYMVDFQLKFSFPFICVIMALIGLPLAFWKEKGGGIALGIGAGIGFSFVYLVFLGLSRALGYSGVLPPIVAAWLPNFTFTLVGAYLFTHVRQ